MAFDDTFTSRVNMLIREPKKGLKKIIPFLKSRLTPLYRTSLELFGIMRLSKPYCGHDELLKIINKREGFFVECGGNDGYGNDPTYYLEKALNWNGIIVEPLPIHTLCMKNRSHSTVYNCAVSSFENSNSHISLIDCNAMSFIEGSIENATEWIAAGEKTQNIKAKKITVPVFPVQKIINEHFTRKGVEKIDLFVADVEGHELEVLQGLDFTKNSPSFLLLEIHTTEKLNEISAYVAGKNYFLIGEIGHRDYIFGLAC